MNSYNVFQKRLLSVAANTRRTMRFSQRQNTPEALAKPAYGPVSPVLVLGKLAQIAPGLLDRDTDVLIAEADQSRWEATREALLVQGMSHARRLAVDPHNLKLDVSQMIERWEATPPTSYTAAMQLIQQGNQAADSAPLVSDQSISTVYCSGLADCVDDARRMDMLREVYRVLRKGGVLRCSVELHDELDGEGLLAERRFTSALESVGFYGIRIVERSDLPVSVSDGREVRAYVVDAFRGKDGPCWDCGQSVIYRGPWRKVVDDDGHEFERDVRAAVCEKTFRIMTSAPYAGEMVPVEPYVAIPLSKAKPFDCSSMVRTPSETKGIVPSACDPSGGCC
ncbi:MAG TPA: class I SAM-dependent methyltransferase [Steroidobacteraceae bacterium]